MGKVHGSALALVAVLFSAAAVTCSANNPSHATSGSGGASTGDGAGGIALAGSQGSTSSGSRPTDGGCASASIKSDLLPANILFLIDRSGSMNCNLPPITASAACEMNPVQMDPTQPTKWAVIKQALKDAIAALPPNASAGITYFSDDDICGVSSMPAVPTLPLTPAQVAAIDKSLDGVMPLGGTPIVGGTILAYKYLNQVAKLTGNKFVVLLTDGTEDCSPSAVQDFLNVQVPAAVSVNIRTFVIGAPGSEIARSFLSQIAYQGGTASSPTCDHGSATPDVGNCQFDMTMSSNLSMDLAAALKAVSGQALTCEFEVPQGADADLNAVNVDYTPGNGGAVVPILKDDSAPCDQGADGWQYAQNDTKIVLCGSICSTVKNDSKAKIDIVLGCQTIVK
jgi:hypothetical protein